MNIAVCICPASDISSQIVLSPDGKGIETHGLISILNPYDEYAIEEAIRTKEKHGGTVYAISVGTTQNKEMLRKAIAMGADEGILLIHDAPIDSQITAQLLAETIKEYNFDIIFMGKQTIDYNGGCVGQLTAALCKYRCISACISLKIEGQNITGKREIENGLETVHTHFPVIITTQKGINEPRYPSLKGTMASKKKIFLEKVVQSNELQKSVIRLELSKGKGKTLFLENSDAGIAELARCLKEDVKIL